MLTALVLHSPKFGATAATIDDSAALAVPGVTAVIPIDEGVAVVGETFHDAHQGLLALQVDWDETNAELRSSEELLAEHRRLVVRFQSFQGLGELPGHRGWSWASVLVAIKAARQGGLLARVGEQVGAVSEERRRAGHPEPHRVFLRGYQLPGHVNVGSIGQQRDQPGGQDFSSRTAWHMQDDKPHRLPRSRPRKPRPTRAAVFVVRSGLVICLLW